MVVVLPAPLTPTIKITKGFWVSSIASGCSQGWRIASMSAASSFLISVSPASLFNRRLAKLPMILALARTPMSELIRSSSSSSSVWASTRRLAKMLLMPPVSLAEDFWRPKPNFCKKLVIVGFPLFTQNAGPFPADFDRKLRHEGCGRSRTFRVGENVQSGNACLRYQFKRVLKIFIAFGRKAADKIGAERCFGAYPTNGAAKFNDIFAGMAATHPF